MHGKSFQLEVIISNANNLLTDLWFQEDLFNISCIYAIIWAKVTILSQ